MMLEETKPFVVVKASPELSEDWDKLHALILERTADHRATGESVLVQIDYEDRGDDIVSVSPNGDVEVVEDGS